MSLIGATLQPTMTDRHDDRVGQWEIGGKPMSEAFAILVLLPATVGAAS